MAKISLNPEILKKISSLNIDAQIAFPKGNALFSYSGDLTTDISNAFEEYKKILDSMASDIQAITSAIPPLQTTA